MAASNKTKTISLNQNVLQLSDKDRLLIRAVEHGLPLCPRPYQAIAEALQTTEEDVIFRLRQLKEKGAIKRYGVVVRHRELGYTANGMVVWNVPDERVDEIGTCIGQYSYVTLSYRRPRRLPDWPYNLFTMVHGSSREEVQEKVQQIIENCELGNIEHSILFSTRRFKQRGASYSGKRPAKTPPQLKRVK